MYVSVPKNYGGVAFSNDKGVKVPPTLPITPPPEEKNTVSGCSGCGIKEKNPLSCLLEAFKNREKGGFDTDDFLLVGLIALLINKEGNADIVLILAMLLLL